MKTLTVSAVSRASHTFRNKRGRAEDGLTAAFTEEERGVNNQPNPERTESDGGTAGESRRGELSGASSFVP